MSLPPELIDEIIHHLPLDEPQALQNCSLVAKSWVHCSQKRLFQTVNISKSTRSSWKDRISPVNLELLHHVRSLTFTIDPTAWLRFPGYRIDSLGDYLPSFHNLESLVLSSMDLQSDISQQVGNFAAFRLTLSSLSLSGCYLSPSVLVIIVNCFPNLIDLQLRAPMRAEDHEPVPPLSRPLRGRLSVLAFRNHDLPVLNQLSDLPPELDELVIGGGAQVTTGYGHIVATYAGSVKRLRLLRGFESVVLQTLSHCRKLRELELYVMLPTQVIKSLITSITSMKLQRIVFFGQGLAERLASSDAARHCNVIDNCLCRLIDRLRELGYEGILEVEFQAWRLAEWGAGSDLKKLLPKFEEKGRVKVAQMLAWRPTRCSDK